MDISQSPRLKVDWLADGLFGPYANAFNRHLTLRRYAAPTIASYTADIAHFARWAETRHLPLDRIDEISVSIFLDDHLPACACPRPARRDRPDHSSALGHLLFVLRAEGAIELAAVNATPVDAELQRYEEYMDHVRGLALGTRTTALRIVGRLLVERFVP